MGIPGRMMVSPSRPSPEPLTPEQPRVSWGPRLNPDNRASPSAQPSRFWDEQVSIRNDSRTMAINEPVDDIMIYGESPRMIQQTSVPHALKSLANYYAPESAERYNEIEAVGVKPALYPAKAPLNSSSLHHMASSLTAAEKASSLLFSMAAKRQPVFAKRSGPTDPLSAAKSRHEEGARTQELESSVVCRQKIFEMYDLGRRIQWNRWRQIQEQGLEVDFIEFDDEQVHDRTNLLFTARMPGRRTYKSLWDVITKFAYEPSLYPKAWKVLIAKAYLDQEFNIEEAVASGEFLGGTAGLFEDERGNNRMKQSIPEETALDVPPAPRGTSPTRGEQEHYFTDLKNQLRGLSNKRKLALFQDDFGRHRGMSSTKRRRVAEAIGKEAEGVLTKPEQPEKTHGEIPGAKRAAYPTPESTPKMLNAALKPGKASCRGMKTKSSKQARVQTTKAEIGCSSNAKVGKATKASAGSALPATRAEAYRWSFRKCFEVVENGKPWGESLAERLGLNYDCTPDSFGTKSSQSNGGYATSELERDNNGATVLDNSKRKKMQYLLLGYAAMMEQHTRATDKGSSEYPDTWWKTQFQKLCPGDVNSASTLGVLMKEAGLFTERKNPQLFDPALRTMLMKRFAEFERRERPYTDWKLKGKEAKVGILVIDAD